MLIEGVIVVSEQLHILTLSSLVLETSKQIFRYFKFMLVTLMLSLSSLDVAIVLVDEQCGLTLCL